MAAVAVPAPPAAPEETKVQRALRRARANAWAAVTSGTIHGLLELPIVVPVEASITQTQINGKSFIWNFKHLLSSRQLYRSLPATALGLVPKCWIHYAFLNFYIGLLIPSGDFKKGSFKESSLCGIATGASEVAFLTPINFVKFRMQRPEWGYTSIANLFATVLRTEGPLAFWKGTLPVFFRNSICMLGMVGFYNDIERKMPANWPRDLRAFCAGCICGVIGSFLSYPFEMWRAARVHNVNFLDDIVKKGPKRLMAGYIPGALRICCHSAALGIVIPRMKQFSQGLDYFKGLHKDVKDSISGNSKPKTA